LNNDHTHISSSNTDSSANGGKFDQSNQQKLEKSLSKRFFLSAWVPWLSFVFFISCITCVLLFSVSAVKDVAFQLMSNGEEGTSWSGLTGASTGIVKTGEQDIIAVIEVLGVITDSRDIVEKLHKAESREEVKAVVLRIDSPGGSVAPTQEIYEEIRRIDAKKPIYASFREKKEGKIVPEINTKTNVGT